MLLYCSLKPGEFKTIVGNILEVTNMHLNLILNPLRSEQNKAAKDQRIGNIFLENATKFEEIHKAWVNLFIIIILIRIYIIFQFIIYIYRVPIIQERCKL